MSDLSSALRQVLAIPCLEPDGVEVKLFFAGAAPPNDTRVHLRVGPWQGTYVVGQTMFLPLPGAARWTPEAPNLLTLSVEVAGISRDVCFGLRRVTARGEKLFLNGEPFYVRGFGCDGDPRGRLSRQVTTVTGYRNYVRRAREFGFNVMRSHSDNNERPAEFLDACDELGLFIWPEFRFDPKDPGSIDLLAQFWNHPSVMWWCWGNELAQIRLLPWARAGYDFVKGLDPSRLVLDNSGMGSFDRDTTDLLSQHLGYYFPHGPRADMFRSYALFALEPPLSGESVETVMQRMREGTFGLGKPVLAHETGNHQAFPDLERRAARMNFARRDELRKKVRADQRQRYLPYWIEGSTKFKAAMDKLWMEQARKSPLLEGFEMWMLADHGNVFAGVIEDGEECTVKPGIDPRAFGVHNAADVLLAEFPQHNFQRIFAPGERFKLQLLASIYGDTDLPAGEAHWRLCAGSTVQGQGVERVRGVRRGKVAVLGELQIAVPQVGSAVGLRLEVSLQRGAKTLSNGWNVWVFPPVDVPGGGQVTITRGLTEPMMRQLEGGGRVLLLLEDPASLMTTRQPFVSVLARFKPQIWEWGHNLGAYVHDHPALAGFPHEGFSDLQFFRAVDFGRKIILDQCPFAPDPIVHAIDLPMMTYSPEIYARNAAYLFELAVGEGKLLVSGFNFTDDAMAHVEVRTLLGSLLRYAGSEDFQPRRRITAEELRGFVRHNLTVPQDSPRLSAEAGWENSFYRDTDVNGFNKFLDRGERPPVVDAPLGDLT